MSDPVSYAGLDWRATSDALFQAAGTATQHRYRLRNVGEEIHANAGALMPDGTTWSWIRLGRFQQIELAMIACERHDFAYASNVALSRDRQLVFVGSERTREIVAQIRADSDGDDVLDMLVEGPRVSQGRPFHRAASYFEAQKDALKQKADGRWILTLTLDAKNVPLWMLQTAPGSHLAMGAVLTTDGSTTEERSWRDRAADAMRRAHVLPQDPVFAEWMLGRYDRWGLIQTAVSTSTSTEVAVATAETLKRLIGVSARSQLYQNRDAVEKLERYDAEYYRDMSQGFAIRDAAAMP